MMARADAVKRTQLVYQHVLEGIGRDLPEWDSVASEWASKLAGCGKDVWLHRCPVDGAGKTVCSCCKLAICPRQQRRYSQAWTHRIRELAKRLKAPRGYSWKLLTVSLRQRGDVFARVEAVVKLRADLARLLRDEYGMLAGVGAFELGDHDNVHLHFLALSEYVPRSILQHWMQGRDCTVRGCHHPADDRCTECKTARCPCHHYAETGDGRTRPRCNGSWYADVRACYVRKGRLRSRGNAADAAAEVVKYACKPVTRGDPGLLDGAELRAEVEHARRVALFHLALRNRHRVETYLAARERAPGEDDAIDDVEPTPEGLRCPQCGGVMHCVAYGKLTPEVAGYAWGRPVRGP
ncbi:MAG TPA: hypothetical protein VGL81_30845 [Polyangiaceae bacterium]|jgi:hypothetical protein